MDRLKTFGLWILLVVVFYIFSNVLINVYLKQRKANEVNNNVTNNNIQVVNETEN